MYAPITLRQQIEGNHVDWHTNKTERETIDILKSPKYQGVVFIGHGSDRGYSTIDSVLTSNDIIKAQVPPKDLLIQHTCYYKTGDTTLREALGAEKGYHLEENTYSDTNYLTAIKRLFIGY